MSTESDIIRDSHTSPTTAFTKKVSIHEHDPHYEKEQEILVHIQELQRQLSIMQIAKEEEETATNTSLASTTPVHTAKHRLIMISNRLPISVSRRNGEWCFSMSSGGLVTALNGIRDDFPFIWVGWFGQEVPEDEQETVRQKLLKEFSCVPVFLSNKMAEEYYNNFSNGILWPIFHYVPLPMSSQGGEKKFNFHSYDSYYQANREFANVVDTLYNEGDILWVHDYHLMILPSMLRASYPTCTIGWFLHTPFPSSEIYRTLPVRKEILNGLLGADLLGFHTYDYARHFLSSCSKILGANVLPKGIEYDNHFTSIGVFPIGIDPDSFLSKLNHSNTKTRIKELCEKFKDKKVIVGVDRLDYIKGIPHRLLAVERLLMRYPEWRGKIILVQIAVPSRTDVEEYRELGSKVNKLVGRINGTFGSLDYSPVHYVNRGVTPNELTALYNIADVCLVTSLRDGMNLVSCEYVVCQNKPCERREGPGVLVLSEFAGSAQSLSGAILINPWNNDDMASALNQALTLSLSEREYRQSKLYRYVTRHSASFWAKSYLTDLEDAYNRSTTKQKLVRLPVKEVVQAYAESKNCLIVLDYDGTLEAAKSFPHLTAPGTALRSLLEKLSKDEKNTLYIVSARQKSLLKRWLGDLQIGLAAENGFFMRNPGSKEWRKMGIDFTDSWRRIVHPIMQYFAERTPGSYIESKESSISWHYGDADRHFGTMQAREMQLHLEDVLCNLPLEVLQEPNVVEVRPHGLNKAVVIQEAIDYLSEPEDLMLKGKIDFVLCVGDSHVDDEMFSFINTDLNHPDYDSLFVNNPKIYSCCIGSSTTSQATYYIESSQQLRSLLAACSDHCE